MVVSPGGWTGRAECLSSELNITGAHSLSATLWVWGGLSFSLCPLSFFSLSSLSLTNTDSGLWGIGFFFLSPKVHRPQKPRALILQKDVDLDYYQNPLKFLLCVTSAESSTEKWRAQFVAYFNRQREHLKADGTDLASFFFFFFFCFHGESAYQDELAVEQPGTLHPRGETRAQAAWFRRSAAGQMRPAERRGWGHAGTPRHLSRIPGQPRLNPCPTDSPGTVQHRIVSTSTSGGPGMHAQRDEHRYWQWATV